MALALTAAIVGCGSPSAPDEALVVAGVVYLDDVPLAGAAAAVFGVQYVYVQDSSIQGYHHEPVESRLGGRSTGADGAFRVEVSVSQCSDPALVRVEWTTVRLQKVFQSRCGEYDGLEFRIRVDTIAGVVRLNDAPVAGAAVEVHACPTSGFLTFCGDERLGGAVTDADGTFELTFPGCQAGGRYSVVADVSEDFGMSSDFVGCLARREVELEASTGNFTLSHTAEGFQCSILFFRATPPDDWVGEPPIAVNPPATGWQRSCGSYPDMPFYWETASE